MKHPLGIAVLFILFAVHACTGSDENKNNRTSVPAAGVTKTDTVETCIMGEEEFDLPSGWPATFEPAEDLDGYIQYAADINFAPGEYGIMAYLRTQDSAFMLLFVEVVDSLNKVKPIGSKTIARFSKDLSFESHCTASCPFDYPVLGMFRVEESGQLQNIEAWTVDKKRKMVYRLKPALVSCQEAWETDYD